MEFTLQSDNIKVTLKEDKQRYDGYNSQLEEDTIEENKSLGNKINNNNILSPISEKDLADSSGNKLIRFEILLKLEDYYLINNIRLKGEMDDITIKKIKFQNINTGFWESVSYFNPDNKEITLKDKDSLSMFSVGLTQFIKIELTIKCRIEIFEKKQGNKETSPLRFMKNMNGDDMNKFAGGSNHNLSMHEINRNNAFKLNNDKKKIFNMNVDYSAKNNSSNHNNSNDRSPNRTRSNVAHNVTEDNIHIENHRNVTKENDHSTICYKLINSKVIKIIVYSQYLYTIPNSTFLLTLLNLKNYFKNNMKFDKLLISSNTRASIGHENYLSALFLTASSMIQARLFIQAWELIHNMQIYIINYLDVNNFSFFKILLEPNHSQGAKNLVLSLSSEQNEIRNRTPIFLTKLEIIKAVCIYEHGHILSFLDSLKNLINIYFLNDYSHINYKISWTKNNEIASDRNFIQNFLLENGKNLGEILITMINDQSEVVTVSSLKILEFILDYNPNVFIPYYSKSLKYLVSFLYPIGSAENTKCLSIKNLQNLNSDNQAVYTNYLKDYDDNKSFFPLELFLQFLNLMNKISNEKETINTDRSKQEKKRNSALITISNMSTFLIKQVNYTLDTMIETLDTLPQSEIISITTKINNILINILKNNETENVTAINITKVIRKLYENVNSSILEIFLKSKKNGLMLNTSGSNPYNVPEYIFNLLSANFSSSSRVFNQFRDYFNHQQVKNQSKTGNFHIPEIILLDNSEMGNLISFLLEKISDECFLFSDRELSMNLLEWLSNSLAIVSNYINFVNTSQIENNQGNLEEFSIFYAYHLLYLLNNLFFSKSEIKQGLSRIFHTKMHPESINHLSKLITILIKFEEVCLNNKKCVILFEPTIEIMKKIKTNYSCLFNVDYSTFFVDQYEKLYSFMSKTGIFNENIFYLLKTINFINFDSEILISTTGSDRAKIVIQNIFTLALKNFSIYYSEDMIELFNSLIFVLRDHLNEKIISDIIMAIINKYNYKGHNYQLCCNKFFEVIIRSKNYFEYLKNIMLKGAESYNEKYRKHEGEIILFKDIHLDFLDKLEIYKKYLEYLRNERFLENCVKNENYEDFLFKHEELIFSERESTNFFISLAKTCNELILTKLNEILLQNFSLLENSFQLLFTNKSLASNNNSPIQNTLSKNPHYVEDAVTISDTNFSKFISCLVKLFSVLERQIKFIIEYYLVINRKARNQNFIADTFNIMSKILISFNNTCEYISTEFLLSLELNDHINISKLKLNFYKSLYESTNFSNLKEIRVRSVFIELMNFFENILIKGKEISPDTNLKDYYSYLVPLIILFLDNSDDYQKIFGIEIIIKIFNIKFDDDFALKTNCEYKDSLTLPTFIWEKILNLTSHFNYKIALFAMYIVQVVAPRDVIENLMNSKFNKFNINSKDSSSFSNLRFSIEPLDIDSKNLSEFFMNEEDLEHLHLFIRDRIIYDCKVKNTEKCNENLEQGNVETEERNEAVLNKIDEVSDADFGKIHDVGEEKASKEKLSQSSKKKNVKNESNRKKKKTSSDNLYENHNYKYSPRDLDKEDNLSLEDLGVVEVDDEIFDNFDDENIPVLKNTYKRKKGSAEKLKTNQNTRNLLMSNHVKKDQLAYDSNKDKEKERYIEKKENYSLDKNESIKSNSFPSKNLQIITKDNTSTTQAASYNNNTKKVFEVMNSVNAQNSNHTQSILKNILVIDENCLVDKQIKKKNGRPQNGLRPATPPLKESKGNRKSSLEDQNYFNQNLNNYNNSHKDNLLPSKQIEDDLMSSPFTTNKYEELNMPLSMDNRKKKYNTNSDKKYEIKSMEELFLEEEEIKETRPVDVINKDYNDFMVDPSNINLNIKESLGGYDEEILSSFENLNLEDFKNNGNAVEDEIIMDDNFNFVNSINKFNPMLSHTDHPILDEINDYLIKGSSYYGNKNPIDYNNNYDDVISNPYFTERNEEIKIEDYNEDIASLDILENDYNSNHLIEDFDNLNKNNRYEEDKSQHADDKIIKTNNFYFGELENSHDIEENDVVGDIHSIHSSESLPMEEYFCKTNSKYESYKETKSKRPPTRYGNREDQIKWDDIYPNQNEAAGNKPTYTTRLQSIDIPLRDAMIERKDSAKSISNTNSNDYTQNNINKTQSELNSNNLNSNTARNVGSVLKNKNKFQSILTLNKASQLNSPALNFNSHNNRTLNSANPNKERIGSPENNDYSSNAINMTNIVLASNLVSKNETQDEISKNYNSNSILNSNLNKAYANKKNIHNLHNLHNLHNKTNLNGKSKNLENEKKISSEFRKILKLKLTKNSDKIFANLKKLSNVNETSRVNNNSRRETLRNEITVTPEKIHELNRIMSNPELLKRDRDIKIIDCEPEDYNCPNNVINLANVANTQNNRQPPKKQSYNIMTNLTESKYLGMNK